MTTTGLTSTGYVALTADQEASDLRDLIHESVDPGLNLDDGTPFGQIIAILAEKFAELGALGAAVYESIDPSQASGNLLVQRAALSGVLPQVATFSTVTGMLTLNASTTVHAGAIAAVAGDPGNTWILTSDAVNDATSTQPVNATFRASQPGPIDAFSGTLTTIATPCIGWTALTNPADSIRGLAADDDAMLRAKRERELQGQGSSDVAAIRARILEIPFMVQASVFQNTTPVGPDANGLPGKSLRVIYWDGPGALADGELIAQTIWANKPAGIQAFGNLTYEAYDSAGVEHDVQFDRALEKPVYVTCTVTAAPNKTIGSTERALIKQAIADYAAAAFNLGVSIIDLPFRASALVPGVSIDVPTFAFDFTASPTNTANLTVTPLQIATVSTTNILVNGL